MLKTSFLLCFLFLAGCKTNITHKDRPLCDQIKWLRFTLQLEEASKLVEQTDATNLEQDVKIDFYLESILVKFEKEGFEAGADLLKSYERNELYKPLKQTPFLRTILSLLKIYLNPNSPRWSNVELGQSILEKYRIKFNNSKPSLIFWPQITLAKIFRRKSQYKKALSYLDSSYDSYLLRKPDLGREILKWHFERFIVLSLLRKREMAHEALKSYQAVVVKEDLPMEYVNLVDSLKSYIMSPTEGKPSVVHALKSFGPGHYTKEGTDFLLKNY